MLEEFHLAGPAPLLDVPGLPGLDTLCDDIDDEVLDDLSASFCEGFGAMELDSIEPFQLADGLPGGLPSPKPPTSSLGHLNDPFIGGPVLCDDSVLDMGPFLGCGTFGMSTLSMATPTAAHTASPAPGFTLIHPPGGVAPRLARQSTKERFEGLLRRALAAGDDEASDSGADDRASSRKSSIQMSPGSAMTPRTDFAGTDSSPCSSDSDSDSEPGSYAHLLMKNPLKAPLSRGNSFDQLNPPSRRQSWPPTNRSGSRSPGGNFGTARSSPGFGRSGASSPTLSPESSARRRLKGASTNPKHAAGRKHVCNICSSRFLCKSKLDRHMLTHTGAKPFGCFCGKRFNQKSALKNHTRRHLKKGDAPVDNVMVSGLNGFSYESLLDQIIVDP
mmetsp:Transcript_26098/g.78417  ORF Transcript_26098/g.78417 Transcript_26098/m.78417 type:complete len:388 (-) Transcript_26098:152-1315(-)